jgi:hypothetical protein
MTDFNFDSYCGNYCGACSIMMAYRTGKLDQFASYWTKENLIESLKAQGICVSEKDSLKLQCHGCKTDTVFINCKHCKIRDCAIGRNMDHCFNCADFPCHLFNNTLFNKDMQQMLPHLKLVKENQNYIKEKGIERWLEEQAKRWKCPECQTTASWYTMSCTNCSADLSKT